MNKADSEAKKLATLLYDFAYKCYDNHNFECDTEEDIKKWALSTAKEYLNRKTN